MTQYLNFSENQLREMGAFNTAKEICQQPQMWNEAIIKLSGYTDLKPWLNNILGKSNLRVIFTGAGTSAYIGDSLAPHLTKSNKSKFESISTTDIVSDPESYFTPENPTLLVSFGRSGDSPESIAALQLGNQVLQDNIFHLIITCNPNGKLATNAQNDPKSYCIVLPEDTLDMSFAMTSSFTTMLVVALAVFDQNFNATMVSQVSTITSTLLMNKLEAIAALAGGQSKKFVFLGSGALFGFAKESALKLLELTAGKYTCMAESSLGFRHGPKSIVDADTTTFILNDVNSYTSNFDLDIFNELESDNIAQPNLQYSTLINDSEHNINGIWLGLPYIVISQIFGFYKSIRLGISPDNPCPSGEVNRVVQGVTLHPYTPNS